jgi:hypothetical protein
MVLWPKIIPLEGYARVAYILAVSVLVVCPIAPLVHSRIRHYSYLMVNASVMHRVLMAPIQMAQL